MVERNTASEQYFTLQLETLRCITTVPQRVTGSSQSILRGAQTCHQGGELPGPHMRLAGWQSGAGAPSCSTWRLPDRKPRPDRSSLVNACRRNRSIPRAYPPKAAVSRFPVRQCAPVLGCAADPAQTPGEFFAAIDNRHRQRKSPGSATGYRGAKGCCTLDTASSSYGMSIVRFRRERWWMLTSKIGNAVSPWALRSFASLRMTWPGLGWH